MDAENILSVADQIESLIRGGKSKEQIEESILDFTDELFSIAKARIRNKRENKCDPNFILNESDLRFCTDQAVAKYRAKRLKCNKIVDIGSGIGVQAIEFAKVCKEVIAIELDKRKVGYAKANAEIVGVTNIKFICGDALESLRKIDKADFIFWDPERPASEVERNLSSLKPSFKEMFSACKSLGPLAIELPPQIERSKIEGDCEFEYVSLDKKLNRLTAYFGKEKKCSVSVVSLPSEERLEYNKNNVQKARTAKEIKSFIYEADSSLIKSGLLDFFVSTLERILIFPAGKKTYLTSDELIKSVFLRPYSVIGKKEYLELKRFLDDLGFGKAILHGEIDDKTYFKIKSGIEKGLKGKKTVHLFFLYGVAYVTSAVDEPKLL